jgi:hypothetical protein
VVVEGLEVGRDGKQRRLPGRGIVEGEIPASAASVWSARFGVAAMPP